MDRLFLPGMVVSAENQGTFSDYHDNSGDGGSSFWPIYGSLGRNEMTCGIFCDNDCPKTLYTSGLGSRLSKN